jgi:hypothetical protein
MPTDRQDDWIDEKECSSENVENYAIITTIDNIQVLGLASEDADFYRNFPPERRKRMIRKVRLALILPLNPEKS